MGLRQGCGRLVAGAVATHIVFSACAAPETGVAQAPQAQEASTGKAGISPLSAEARCSGPRDFQLQLKWRIDDPGLRNRAQVLEFSLLRQDFDSSPGRVEVEVVPGVTEHTFRPKLAVETVYHWRVKLPAEGDGAQVVSESASFIASGCPGADFPDG
jgi:hypothetical protein